MRRSFAGAVLLLMAFGAGACGDSSGSKIPSMSGSWLAATTTSGGTPFFIKLALTQTDRSVVGTGTIELTNGTVVSTVSVSGTHTYPTVIMTLQESGFEPLIFQGEFAGDDSVRGQLDGSGFVATATTFNRQ